MTHSHSHNSQHTSQASEDDQLLHGGRMMPLAGHLDELRARVIRSMAAVLVLFFATMLVAEHVVGFLKQPLVVAGLRYNKPIDLNFIHPLDPFYISVQVSLLVALVLASPVWLYQFWRFIEPALYPKERRYVMPFAVACVGMFVAGVVFCYLFVFPIVVDFSIELGLRYGTPMISLSDYFSLLVMFVLGFGLVFELPVILILLGELDLIDARDLARHRSVVFVVILIVSSVLTPPDPFSMLIMAAPVYAMFEGALVIMRLRQRRATAPTQDAATASTGVVPRNPSS